jgi:mannose/fructose/N-acetylgalactosamine-specific phosphotransferase system component IID
MSRKIFAAMTIGVAALGAATPTWAHHSFSSVFDANMPSEVRGVMAEIDQIMEVLCTNVQTATLMEGAAKDNYGRKE